MTMQYTSRAIKGTGLLDETRTLLRAWSPGEPLAAFKQRVRAQDLLGRATGSRTTDIVANVFGQRLLQEGDEPARSLRRALAARGNGRWFTDLCLLYTARSDVVVREAPQIAQRKFCPKPGSAASAATASPMVQARQHAPRKKEGHPHPPPRRGYHRGNAHPSAG